jgi:hypothetical protein
MKAKNKMFRKHVEQSAGLNRKPWSAGSALRGRVPLHAS